MNLVTNISSVEHSEESLALRTRVMEAIKRSNKRSRLKEMGQAYDVLWASLLKSPRGRIRVAFSNRVLSAIPARYNPMKINFKKLKKVAQAMSGEGIIKIEMSDTPGKASRVEITPRFRPLWRAERRDRSHLVLPGERIVLRSPLGSNLDYEEQGETFRGRRVIFEYEKFMLRHPVKIGEKNVGVHLRRIYNGDFSLGGRFYGHYHHINKDLRLEMTIDGEATAELDVSSCALQLLSIIKGIPEPLEPYEMEGVGRHQAKIIWQIILNSSSPREAVSAIRQKLKVSEGSASKFFLAAKRKWPQSRPHWCCAAGLWLQKEESKLLEAALIRLPAKEIPFVAVHDAYIVRQSDAENAQEELHAISEELWGKRLKWKTNQKPVSG